MVLACLERCFGTLLQVVVDEEQRQPGKCIALASLFMHFIPMHLVSRTGGRIAMSTNTRTRTFRSEQGSGSSTSADIPQHNQRRWCSRSQRASAAMKGWRVRRFPSFACLSCQPLEATQLPNKSQYYEKPKNRGSSALLEITIRHGCFSLWTLLLFQPPPRCCGWSPSSRFLMQLLRSGSSTATEPEGHDSGGRSPPSTVQRRATLGRCGRPGGFVCLCCLCPKRGALVCGQGSLCALPFQDVLQYTHLTDENNGTYFLCRKVD